MDGQARGTACRLFFIQQTTTVGQVYVSWHPALERRASRSVMANFFAPDPLCVSESCWRPMTTAAKGRGEGQDSSTSTGAGGAGLLQGWPQCGELNGGGGHSQLQSSNPESSSGESAMCGALGFVCVHPFAGQSKGFLPKKTCFRAGQSLSSLSITHHHGKRALQPTCLSHNNEAKRALQPTCPARDWRSVAICHTGFNTVHTCTMGLPWQRATKACPKLLVSSCPKDLRTNKSTENVGFSKQ